jgi:Tfp pilus assembly protein PilF
MLKTALTVAVLVGLAACAHPGPPPSPEQQARDNAAMMLLLGTGFLNGYNAARQPVPVVSTHCTTVGAVVNCLSY